MEIFNDPVFLAALIARSLADKSDGIVEAISIDYRMGFDPKIIVAMKWEPNLETSQAVYDVVVVKRR